MSVDYAVRKAVTDRLQEALGALSPAVPFHDHPPADVPMPYVTLDRALGTNSDILANDYTTFLFYFSIWSAARGHRQVQNIAGAMRAALNQADLTPAEGGIVSCRVTRTDIIRDSDGVTYQGSVEVEVLAEH